VATDFIMVIAASTVSGILSSINILPFFAKKPRENRKNIKIYAQVDNTAAKVVTQKI
jgi:hypothetical protein